MKQNFSLRDQIYFVHTILTITSACFIIALSSIKIYSQTEYAIGHSMTASVLNFFTCIIFYSCVFNYVQFYLNLQRKLSNFFIINDSNSLEILLDKFSTYYLVGMLSCCVSPIAWLIQAGVGSSIQTQMTILYFCLLSVSLVVFAVTCLAMIYRVIKVMSSGLNEIPADIVEKRMKTIDHMKKNVIRVASIAINTVISGILVTSWPFYRSKGAYISPITYICVTLVLGILMSFFPSPSKNTNK